MPVILNPDRERRLEDDLKAARERVLRRFAGQVEEPLVEQVVAESALAMSDARIKDFVGLLVERMSVARLRSLA